MGLIGNFQAMAYAGNPPSINYVMFVVAFAIVSLFYLFPAAINVTWSGHPVFLVIVDSMNCVFWLTAAVELAARLQADDCGDRVCNNISHFLGSDTDNPQNYLTTNPVLKGGAPNTERCREAQASDAFLWFGWVAFMVSLFLSILQYRNWGAKPTPRTGAARPMAQV